MEKDFLTKDRYRFRFLYHLLFWLAYFCFYVVQYKVIYPDFENWKWAVSLSITIWPDILAAYFTNYVLLPLFLMRRKYFQFTVLLLVSASVFIIMQRVLLIYVDYPIIEPEALEKMKFWDFNPFYSFVNIYSIVALVTVIKLLKYWIREQQLRSDLEKQNKSSELAMLRSQVNPHFLFNTLNNIDSLIMMDQEKASDAIIKLSDIMRYMLYDSNTDKVGLDKEINYLRSYISLQRLRMQNPAFVSFSVDGDYSKKTIAPMILIPFVENAFKHGKKTVSPPGIVISLVSESSKIIFEVKNQVDDTVEVNQDATAGIGLANIKRRLELLYPGQYDLKISSKDGTYLVFLSIDI